MVNFSMINVNSASVEKTRVGDGGVLLCYSELARGTVQRIEGPDKEIVSPGTPDSNPPPNSLTSSSLLVLSLPTFLCLSFPQRVPS